MTQGKEDMERQPPAGPSDEQSGLEKALNYLQQQFGSSESESSEATTQQESQATNTSFDTGAGEESTGYDSPPQTSSWLSNLDAEASEHMDPYYPPGGAKDSESLASKDEDEESA